MLVFGPIPSRRLGQSLGINNIPPKICTYNCVYCQVGLTTWSEIDRQKLYDPEQIAADVQQKVDQVRNAGGQIDFLSFVPDGEPTLDLQLGKTIELLRPLGIPVAVFTNASLLWNESVRHDLERADLVSVKVDSVDPAAWRIINRADPRLSLDKILDGIRAFSDEFKGELITETMLVRGVNDSMPQLIHTAAFLQQIQPGVAYVGLPTRPPAEKWVQTPVEEQLIEAYQIFSTHVDAVEYLVGFSSAAFDVPGDSLQNILDITEVHPMREREALNLLKRGGVAASELDRLVAEGLLARVVHEGQAFYIRKLRQQVAKPEVV
ncbi:MAG: radical SAM protein [Bacteroidetes bacterium]|nr:MAG: radical SAM protein [Bacteroidota bacterium]